MRSLRTLAAGSCALLLLSGCGLADARSTAIANAKVKPLDMAHALRPGLVGMPDYPATGWQPQRTPVGPTPTLDKNPLSAIGLRDADLATGAIVAEFTDGTSLGIPTLDFCEAKYPSEQLRVKRLQTGAFDQSGSFTGLSTEVVQYESAAAAKQALGEVIAARLACPVGKVITTYDGHTLKFAFHPAPGPSNTPLVGADSRLIIHTTMDVDGKPQTAFLVYQIDGPVLAAMYATSASGKVLTQSSLDGLYGLAGMIAKRLQAYVAKHFPGQV